MSIMDVTLREDRASNWLSINLGVGLKCLSRRCFLDWEEHLHFLLDKIFNPRLESPNVPVVKIRSPLFAPFRVNSFPFLDSPIIVIFKKKLPGDETISPPESSTS